MLDNGGRHWNDAATSQRDIWGHRRSWETRKDAATEPLEGMALLTHLDLKF